MDDCLFCKIVSGEIPCHKLYETDQVIAFLDIFPVSKGHTLFVQKEHEQDILHSSDENAQALLATARTLAPHILKTVGSSDANLIFNAGAHAGQTVFHTHLHLIPRHEGDGLKTWPQGETDHQAFAMLAETIKKHL
jgi:histidine triad (HIT) family protein